MTAQRYKQLVTKSFPKILGVGFNYFGHTDKILQKGAPKNPTIFDKAWTSLKYIPRQIHLPLCKQNQLQIEYQLQLGVYINKTGKNIKMQDAMSHIGGYFIGIDITNRTLLRKLRSVGLPFTKSKSIDDFSIASQLMQNIKDPYQLLLQLKINGISRQITDPEKMYFKINQIINFASQHMTLQQGDLIYTGTPQGVGPLKIGDHVQCTAVQKSQPSKLLSSLDLKILQ